MASPELTSAPTAGSPKKTLTKEQQAKLAAARMAAPKKRLDIRISQESMADTIKALDKLNAEINVQLDAVKDDVVTVHKMMVLLDRAILNEDWGKVSSTSAAIHAFAMNISRRVETCAAQATVANRILAVIRVNKDA